MWESDLSESWQVGWFGIHSSSRALPEARTHFHCFCASFVFGTLRSVVSKEELSCRRRQGRQLMKESTCKSYQPQLTIKLSTWISFAAAPTIYCLWSLSWPVQTIRKQEIRQRKKRKTTNLQVKKAAATRMTPKRRPKMSPRIPPSPILAVGGAAVTCAHCAGRCTWTFLG